MLRFQTKDILDYANYSLLSYKELEEVKNLFDSKEDLLINCINCPRYYSGNTGAQLYILNHKSNLIVVFRGTEEIKDIITDINMKKTKMKLSSHQYPEVHSGFLNQFMTVEDKINDEIKKYLRENEKERNIIFTGHSLGGALATLAYCYFNDKYGNISNMGMVNFGSPRVGGKNFYKLFNKNCKNSIRIVNRYDPVPCLPTRRKYKHVNKREWVINKDIKTTVKHRYYWVIKNTILSIFGWGYSSFKDHSCENYIEEIKTTMNSLLNQV